MAVGDYRFTILPEPEVAASGDLHFHDVNLEVLISEGPDVWELVNGGHFTQVMPGVTIIAIEAGAGTVTQKRALVLDALADLVLARGVAQSDQARRALRSLLPGGIWPGGGITVDLTLP